MIGTETALEHVVRDVPMASPGDSAGAILDAMRGRTFGHAADVAVCEEGRLRGLVKMVDLLAAPAGATAGELMDADPPTVEAGADQERAAWKAVRHGESCIAVIGDDGRFAGLVPPQRLLSVLLHEHVEDLARLGGYLKGRSIAMSASGDPMLRRLARRLPWLVVGLAGALAAAVIVSFFERQLAHNVVLAFFIPGIVYLSDAVGTQTETVIVRDLSFDIPIRQVGLSELVTGAASGLILGLLAFPVVLTGWGRADVALSFSAALAAACGVATLVALTLPVLLARAGADPAFGSGPLATVITDLSSIAVYFAVAAVLM